MHRRRCADAPVEGMDTSMSMHGTGQSPGAVPVARPGVNNKASVGASTMRPPVQRTGHGSEEGPAASAPRDLRDLRLPELRTLRRDAQRDEADLSYVRRLVQGRIDILRAELARRRDPESPVVDRLSEILADTPSLHRSSARHVTLSNAAQRRVPEARGGDAGRGRTLRPRRPDGRRAAHRDGTPGPLRTAGLPAPLPAPAHRGRLQCGDRPQVP